MRWKNDRREYVSGRKAMGGKMSGEKNDWGEYVLGGKTTGGNMS